MTTMKVPVHEQVYRRLREKILFGELAPGQAVTIYGLVDELDVGMTPVREAIRRLTAEGALLFQGNRRVCLPEINKQDFLDMVYVRSAVEPKLASMASKNVTKDTVKQLRAIDDKINAAIKNGNVHDYMRFNHKFHFTIYELAESDLLYSITATLWLRYGPLYRVIAGKWGTSKLLDRHDETIEVLSTRNHEAVGKAVLADIEQGFEIVKRLFD